jgi:hypothetical protein
MMKPPKNGEPKDHRPLSRHIQIGLAGLEKRVAGYAGTKPASVPKTTQP